MAAQTLVVVQSGGQGAVAPPVLGHGAVPWRRRRGREQSTLQVLLKQLPGDARLSG